jgi:hypothetical protein
MTLKETVVGRRTSRKARRYLVALALAVVTSVAAAVPALAHTPIQLDKNDVLPWKAPLVLHGTDPVSLFGTLARPWDIRSAQLHMDAGQNLVVGLTIPDEAPENALATDQLPTVLLITPDGRTITPIRATTRIPISTEDGLHLLVLAQYTTTAAAGTYSIIVTGTAASRFAVSTGIEGGPFQGVARGTVATDAQLQSWYDTPPGPGSAVRSRSLATH